MHNSDIWEFYTYVRNVNLYVILLNDLNQVGCQTDYPFSNEHIKLKFCIYIVAYDAIYPYIIINRDGIVSEFLPQKNDQSYRTWLLTLDTSEKKQQRRKQTAVVSRQHDLLSVITRQVYPESTKHLTEYQAPHTRTYKHFLQRCIPCVNDFVGNFLRRDKGVTTTTEGSEFLSRTDQCAERRRLQLKTQRTSHSTERKRTEPWLAVQSPYQTPSLPPPHRVLSHQPSVITSHHPLLTRSPRISRSTVRTIRQTSLFAFETPPDTSGNAFASRFSLIFRSPQIAPSFFTALDVHSLDASSWCRSATPTRLFLHVNLSRLQFIERRIIALRRHIAHVLSSARVSLADNICFTVRAAISIRAFSVL